jgi:gamma-glutamylcyclotransferase (GGCT)/AIG2-like uncharacterized protein YtfP
MRPKSKTVAADGSRANGKRRPVRRSPTPQYLFVYGTLKRGGKSHKQLRKDDGVRFRSSGRIRADLYRLQDEDYPGAVLTSTPNRFVQGDLFVLRDPQRTLRDLDEFEEVDEGLFRRELVDVWSQGRRVKAWAYLYARPLAAAEMIPTGIYSSH